jgi:hypothetical protein
MDSTNKATYQALTVNCNKLENWLAGEEAEQATQTHQTSRQAASRQV